MSQKLLFNKSQIIAHRGACQIAPENTIAAFQAAKQHGINWIELDVQLTKDNIAVIFHDKTLERTTNYLTRNITGNITGNNYNNIKDLDAGSWFDPKFSDQKIPTLKQTLKFCNANKINMCIEIKTAEDINKKHALVKHVAQDITPYLNNNSNISIIISSFCYKTLELIREILPDIDIAIILEIHNWKSEFEENIQNHLAKIKKLNAISLNINHNQLTENRVNQLKKLIKYIIVWVVNNNKIKDKLFNWGIDAIISDKV